MNAIIAMGLSALCFSFFPLFNSFGLMMTSPILFALMNQIATITVVFIIFFVLTSGNHGPFSMIKAFFSLSTDVKLTALFSGISVYLGGVFFLFSLNLMSKAGATLIMELRPLLAMFIAPFFMFDKHWERLTLTDIFLIFLTVIGLLMLTASGDTKNIQEFIGSPFHTFAQMDAYAYIGALMALLSALCFAFSGVSRAHMASELPHEFRIKYFKEKGTVSEAVYCYMMAYILGLPLSLLLLLFLEPDAYFSSISLAPAFLNGFALVGTSVFFSYAILKARNANISLVLYLAPLLAAVWLYMAGFSQITEMIVIGGVLIITVNILLFLQNQKKA